MSRLSELSRASGYSLRDLSEKMEIKYTTLISIGKRNKFSAELIEHLAIATDNDTEYVKKVLSSGALNPFIKWVGGKRQLLPELLKFVPQNINTYYEPFIGGGALLLRLSPSRAIVNDYNDELINAWRMVKDHPNKLLGQLNIHSSKDTKNYYLSVRAADRDGRITKMSDLERAGRFIYLNKAGYNGLWRVNSKGQNNVPWGTHTRVNVPENEIVNVSKYLNQNKVNFLRGDYKVAVESAKKGDFVYFDPPYIPTTPTSTFTSYTKNGFGLVQQEELRDTALKLARKGVKVMLSNSEVPLIEELYSNNIFRIHHVRAKRMINSNGAKRGKVGEVIITTY